MIRRQRRTIPLVRLSDILGVAGAPTGAKVPIATIGYSGHRMGFIVDAFVGEQQIVIKTLGTHLAKVDNVAGVTILGAGEVVPILNVPDGSNQPLDVLVSSCQTGPNEDFDKDGRLDLLLRPGEIDALQRAGAQTLWVGAESGSQRILDAMDKGTRVEQIHEAARRLKWAAPRLMWPVNLLVLPAALRSVTSLDGMDQPWTLLQDQLGRMHVESRLLGGAYVASGVCASS